MASNSLKLETYDYADPEVGALVNRLSEINLDVTYYLLLLTGPYVKGKRAFIEKFSSVFGKNITHIDLMDMVSLDLEETKKNIDSLFDSLDKEDYLLFFSNGDHLCGAYTGFTYSKNRYATPQERYLLDKLNKIEKIVILDIQDEDNIDRTLQRHSHALVHFDRPKSFLKRMAWKLGNTTFHGHNITSKRPVTEI